MGAESEYRSELFALDKASLIERIAEAEARQLREQLEAANASKVVNLYRQPEIDALRSQLERLQSGFDALCTAHADLGQQAAKLEAQIERAYMPVLEAARKIRHWHDDEKIGGMVVSAEHVRQLWAAIESADALLRK